MRSGIVCDRQMLAILKFGLFKTVCNSASAVRKLWAVRKVERDMIGGTLMLMLKLMLGIRTLDKVSNVRVKEKADVECVNEKMRKYLRWWMGHVESRSDRDPMKIYGAQK